MLVPVTSAKARVFFPARKKQPHAEAVLLHVDPPAGLSVISGQRDCHSFGTIPQLRKDRPEPGERPAIAAGESRAKTAWHKSNYRENPNESRLCAGRNRTEAVKTHASPAIALAPTTRPQLNRWIRTILSNCFR